MSWSYDPSDLDTTTVSGRLNTVRLLVGDNTSSDQQVQNEEILFSLSEKLDNVYEAAAWIARIIASKYARLVDTTIDGSLSSKYSDLRSQYTSLADTLDSQARKNTNVLGVVAGGIRISDVMNVRQDTNRVDPSFRRDQFRNPPTYTNADYE